LHHLLSLSIKFRLYTRSPYPRTTLLHYIGGPPAGSGPGGGCLQEKRREAKTSPCLHIWKVVPDRKQANWYPWYLLIKSPAYTGRQTQNTGSRSLQQIFFGECLNSAGQVPASHSCFMLTTVHARRANPNSSGLASWSKPFSGCATLEASGLFCPASSLHSFPGRRIFKKELGRQKENTLKLAKKLE